MTNEKELFEQYIHSRAKLITQFKSYSPDSVILDFHCAVCFHNFHHFLVLPFLAYENLTDILIALQKIQHDHKQKICAKCQGECYLNRIFFSMYSYGLESDFWVDFHLTPKEKHSEIGLLSLSGVKTNLKTGLPERESQILFSGVDLLFRKGIIAKSKKEWKTALKFFQQAIEKDPNFIEIYKELALVYMELKRRPLAKEMIKKYLNFNDKDCEGHVLLGFLYGGENLFSHAKIEMEKAIELDPSQTRAYFYLGKIYQEQGKTGMAKEMWKKTLEIDPNHDLAKLGLEELELIEHETN